jgi:hypothetical protein
MIGEVRAQIVVENQGAVSHFRDRDLAARDQDIKATAADPDTRGSIGDRIGECAGIGHLWPHVSRIEATIINSATSRKG